MEYAEITTDDLFDLGFEPLVTENSKTIEFEHPELGIRLWKGMFNPNPESRFWKYGLGKEKIQFQSIEQLQEFMEQKRAEREEG